MNSADKQRGIISQLLDILGHFFNCELCIYSSSVGNYVDKDSVGKGGS